MRGHRTWVAAAFAVTLIASGCSGTTATPTASATATPTASATVTPTAMASPSPTAAISVSATTTPGSTPTAGATATASPSYAVAGFYLRSWGVAPVGPENTFGNVPTVISGSQLLSARYLVGPNPAPLYAPPTRQTISQVGLTKILAEAQNDGLLGPETSFVCPHSADAPMMAGTGTDYLVLIVGGVTHQLKASCPYQQPTLGPGAPAPVTWAAFEHFKNLLSDPASWLGAQIGSETAYDPARLAVLVVPQDVSLGTPDPADVVQWPLATPFASFGIAFFGFRCGVVADSDAATLLAVVKGSYETTVFRDASGAFAALIVRAFMPGEPDPCQAG